MTMMETAERIEVRGARRVPLGSALLGRELELQIVRIGIPREGDRAYPAVYVLDGNGIFSVVAEIARLLTLEQIQPHFVVGVGYSGQPSPMTLDRERTLDFTPTASEQYLADYASRAPDSPVPQLGGAGPFLEALLTEVVPLIEESLPADPAARVLCGFSLGGLFTLNTLLERPEAFAAYIAGSPSLWWDERYVIQREQTLARRRDDLPARVFVSAGEREAGDRMLENAAEFVSALRSRNYPSLELEWCTFPDETHVSVIPATMSRGLRSVLR